MIDKIHFQIAQIHTNKQWLEEKKRWIEYRVNSSLNSTI